MKNIRSGFNVDVRKLLSQLPEPQNEIEEIAYQSHLPNYHPEIINEYNQVQAGVGDKILELIIVDIIHLRKSKEAFEKMNLGIKGQNESWKDHLQKSGWNVSGKYRQPK